MSVARERMIVIVIASNLTNSVVRGLTTIRKHIPRGAVNVLASW
jgi:hypothetical protein